MAFPTKSRQWLILRWTIIFGTLFAAFLMSVVVRRPYAEFQSSSSSKSRGGETSLHQVDNSTAQLNNDLVEAHHAVGIDGTKLTEQFEVAKAKMIEKVKEAYGTELFDQQFMTDWNGGTERVTQGRRYFLSPSVPKENITTNENDGPSWDRFVRRIAVKILLAQLQNNIDNNGDNKMIPFIWATGGHSSAAGHGNYFNESYTYNMEKTVKGVFEAVGLELVARNYAMGGSVSGKELSSCINAIYGQDMDVLSWDFGLTDGRNTANMEHYIYRSQKSPSRPAIFAVGAKFGRQDLLKRLEDMGLTTLYDQDSLYKDILAAMPKCDGWSPPDIEALPPMVRDCHCTKVEGNDGNDGYVVCSQETWSNYGNATCQKRSWRVSWHPGWKWHGLVGNLMALSLMEVVGDAVDLIVNRGSDPVAFLQELQKQQNDEYNLFEQGSIPDDALKLFGKESKDDPAPPTDIDMQAIYKGPNICHTARLPAETRHLGILTESNEKGMSDYFKGEPFKIAKPINGVTPLVYDPLERQPCAPYVGIDYKDWFHYSQDWSKLTVPNELEKQVYGHATGADMKGYIMVCFVTCSMNICPRNTVNADALSRDRAEFRVNDQVVTEMTLFGHDCVFLKGEQGHEWKPNSNGQYEVSAKIKEEKSIMRVSSIVLY